MSEIDACLARLADDRTYAPAVARLAALGTPALLRLIAILDGTRWYGTPPGNDVRDFAERLEAALAAVAQARPEAFLEEAARPGRLECHAVVAAAGALKDPRAVELLFSAAGAASWSSRWTAIRVLARRRSARAAATLVRALKDRDSLVRMAAAEGLAGLGDERALTPLREALAAKSNARWPGLRAALARAAARIAARRERRKR